MKIIPDKNSPTHLLVPIERLERYLNQGIRLVDDIYNSSEKVQIINPQYSMENQEQKPTTIGEQRVRTKFNPSLSSEVDLIKQKTAELINICESLKEKDPRLAALSMTSFEEGAMWAVKLATA